MSTNVWCVFWYIFMRARWFWYMFDVRKFWITTSWGYLIRPVLLYLEMLGSRWTACRGQQLQHPPRLVSINRGRVGRFDHSLIHHQMLDWVQGCFCDHTCARVPCIECYCFVLKSATPSFQWLLDSDHIDAVLVGGLETCFLLFTKPNHPKHGWTWLNNNVWNHQPVCSLFDNIFVAGVPQSVACASILISHGAVPSSSATLCARVFLTKPSLNADFLHIGHIGNQKLKWVGCCIFSFLQYIHSRKCQSTHCFHYFPFNWLRSCGYDTLPKLNLGHWLGIENRRIWRKWLQKLCRLIGPGKVSVVLCGNKKWKITKASNVGMPLPHGRIM